MCTVQCAICETVRAVPDLFLLLCVFPGGGGGGGEFCGFVDAYHD